MLYKEIDLEVSMEKIKESMNFHEENYVGVRSNHSELYLLSKIWLFCLILPHFSLKRIYL